MQGVVRVEDFLVERLPTGLHELDIVDEQDIVLPVSLMERELCAGLNRADKVIQERLRRDVEDLATGVVLLHVIADRVQEVGLTEP